MTPTTTLRRIGLAAVLLGLLVPASAGRALGWFESLSATQASFVASNLVYGTTGNAMVVEASGTSLDPGGSVVSRPLVVGNTLSDGGGAGVLSSASRNGPDGDVRSEPQLWDNLITFHAGPGVEETTDDEPNGVVAWINGAEVYRSASMPAGPLAWNSAPAEHESSNADSPVYGQQDISTLGNPALQNGQNLLAVGVWNTDPGSDDLVLVPRVIVNQEYPPIDAGHLEAPRIATEDLDRGLRIMDGLRDGSGRPDTGADER